MRHESSSPSGQAGWGRFAPLGGTTSPSICFTIHQAGWGRCLALLLILTLTSGCNATRQWLKQSDQEVAQQQQRRAEAVSHIQEQVADALYKRALSSLDQNDEAGCRQTLEELLKRHPEHRPARLLLAEMHFLNKQPDRSRLLLQSLLEESPGDAGLHHALGMSLDALGQAKKARYHFQQAAQLDPGNEVFQVSWQTVDGASFSTEFASAPSGNDPVSVILAGAVDALHRNQPEQAIQILEPAVSAHSHSAALSRTLGVAYYRAGNHRAAADALSRAVSLDNSSALSYVLLGSVQSRLAQHDLARESFRQAAALDDRLARLP